MKVLVNSAAGSPIKAGETYHAHQMMQSEFNDPITLGQDRLVSINELVDSLSGKVLLRLNLPIASLESRLCCPAVARRISEICHK